MTHATIRYIRDVAITRLPVVIVTGGIFTRRRHCKPGAIDTTLISATIEDGSTDEHCMVEYDRSYGEKDNANCDSRVNRRRIA